MQIDDWQEELKILGIDPLVWANIAEEVGEEGVDLHDPREQGRLLARVIDEMPAVRFIFDKNVALVEKQHVISQGAGTIYRAYYPAEGHHIDSITPPHENLGALCIYLLLIAAHLRDLRDHIDFDAERKRRDERVEESEVKQRRQRKAKKAGGKRLAGPEDL